MTPGLRLEASEDFLRVHLASGLAFTGITGCGGLMGQN